MFVRIKITKAELEQLNTTGDVIIESTIDGECEFCGEGDEIEVGISLSKN